MNELVIAGAGSGNPKHLTREVAEALGSADVVCASKRFMNLVPNHTKFIELKKFADTFAEIERESGQVLMLVSGDPGLYSLLTLAKKRFPREAVRVLPGLSSMQILCAHARETWNDAVILSGHGRTLKAWRLLNAVERSRLVVLFCDKLTSPDRVCQHLAGLTCDVDVFIGANLGSESEQVLHGRPQDFITHDFPELSLMLVRNNTPFVCTKLHPRDDEFGRVQGVVMTNECVRSVILGRLNVNAGSVLWDIGAGTGSISIGAGLEAMCEVHAVERKSEAAGLIAQNAAKFHLHNIEVHNCNALDVIGTLPAPTHVFIGGSNGELTDLLHHLEGLSESVNVVVACVTLETLSQAYEVMKGWLGFEAVQVGISTSKTLTDSLTLMKAQSPVTILNAKTK